MRGISLYFVISSLTHVVIIAVLYLGFTFTLSIVNITVVVISLGTYITTAATAITIVVIVLVRDLHYRSLSSVFIIGLKLPSF